MDYEVARIFRNHLIPNAVLWFTGEAVSDEEDEDDEEDDEDDDEDDNEEDLDDGGVEDDGVGGEVRNTTFLRLGEGQLVYDFYFFFLFLIFFILFSLIVSVFFPFLFYFFTFLFILVPTTTTKYTVNDFCHLFCLFLGDFSSFFYLLDGLAM